MSTEHASQVSTELMPAKIIFLQTHCHGGLIALADAMIEEGVK
jgi:hypothetical protein